MCSFTVSRLAGRLVAGTWLITLLIACSTVRVTSTWVDEARVGQPIDDVVVVAVSHHLALRRRFEESFVAQLRASGVTAQSSADIVPSESTPTRGVLEPELKKLGTRNVLVTHLKRVEREDSYSPRPRTDPRSSFASFDNWAPANLPSLGPDNMFRTFHLSTRLYDFASGQAIWAIESSVLEPEVVEVAINEVVSAAAADLRKNGLIK